MSFFGTKTILKCLVEVILTKLQPIIPVFVRAFFTVIALAAVGGLGLRGRTEDASPAGGTIVGNPLTNSPAHREHGYNYIHDELKEGPLSIHIFKVDRTRHDLFFATTLGNGKTLGMSTVSDQLKLLAPALGKPLAAVNGDFYLNDAKLAGDPRDLQIYQGELVSAPNGHACFWIDLAGDPQSTNIQSRFRVIWPDQSSTPFGLNELRENETAVLYSAALGSATPANAGTELILENPQESSWLPLKVGQVLRARVRAVRASGETPLTPETLVLSLGPKLAGKAAALPAGAVIQLVTETFPRLTGITTAIGGGPTLVHASKAMEWSGFLMRHPRTAIGWNRDYCFLVEVDGRQNNLSIGMTFPELAAYMVKLGCQEAMNLDGGGSATMWVFGHVINSPSEGHERPGANTLVIMQSLPPGQESVRRPP